MHSKDGLLRTSRWAMSLAVFANRLFLAAVLLGILLSWVFSDRFAAMLIHDAPRADVPSEMTGLRLLMLIGVAMAIATEVLLSALAQILATTRAGDPFIAANSRRLRTIGWALLSLQLLDFPAALLARLFPSLGSAAPDGSFSPGGWIAVFMVFVLSRVFAAGSAMKDDLEGTV